MNRFRRTLLAVVAASLLLAAVPSVPASAASRDGWVRVAHMSPDTVAVNVTLSSLSGNTTLFRLTNVAYGAISNYMRLPAGTYALAMVPAGKNDANATPVVSGSVTITAGKAETVAAIGKNDDLKTAVFSDDLSEVMNNDARVRILAASVMHSSVTVKAGSKTLASDVAFGDVSRYADVTAGTSQMQITAGSATATVDQRFAAGSSHTLFVIDNAKGGLTVAPAVDSAAATVVPVGSLAAGGGGLASSDTEIALLLAAIAAAGGLLTTGLMVRRRSGVSVS